MALSSLVFSAPNYLNIIDHLMGTLFRKLSTVTIRYSRRYNGRAMFIADGTHLGGICQSYLFIFL